MALVLRWDREHRLVPVPADDLDSWQLIEPRCQDERAAWSGGAAFSPLFQLLPGGAPLARLADRFPETAEKSYRWVADRRSAFGKPIPAALARWADRVIAARESQNLGAVADE